VSRACRSEADPGGLALCLGAGVLRCFGGWLFHALLQRPDALSQAFAEFGQLLGSKDQKGNKENDQQVHRLEQTFEHYKPPGELEPQRY